MDDLTHSPSDEREFRDTAREVSRHSMLVRQLRLAVPALAVGLLITYALSATPPRVDRAFAEQFAGIELDDEGGRLTAPRYDGEDLDGQPFELAATAAVRPHDAPEVVNLDRPEARRTRADGQENIVRSLDGTYDEGARILDLRDQVELEQRANGGTYLFTTEEAQMDVDSQVVSTTARVQGVGEGGTIDAGSATFYQNEDRLVLENGVKIRLEPTKPTASDEDETEGDSR